MLTKESKRLKPKYKLEKSLQRYIGLLDSMLDKFTQQEVKDSIKVLKIKKMFRGYDRFTVYNVYNRVVYIDPETKEQTILNETYLYKECKNR